MEMQKHTNRPERVTPWKRAWLLGAMLLLAGCRICADCEDQAYPAYGGAWQRTIRDTGRVGSMFDPAGARAFDLASREQPQDISAQERKRYLEETDGIDRSEDEDLDDESSDADDEQADRLRERQRNLRDRDLDDIENPKEQEQQKKKLDEIDVKVIRGTPAPPSL